MKKIYIPTMDELYLMQDMGANIYKYLLSKTIESMIMADVIYEEEDMFEVSYEQFSEYPEIVYAIARMYPERIKDSIMASSDVDLCAKLIPNLKQPDLSIYGLDNITQFNDDVLKNPMVIRKLINTLASELQKCPRYRFEYKGPNDILDSIFSCEISTVVISKDIIDDMACIEPAFYFKFRNMMYREEDKKMEDMTGIGNIIRYRYASRYGIDSYSMDKDLLTNSSDKVKKLVRYLEQHKHNYQD